MTHDDWANENSQIAFSSDPVFNKKNEMMGFSFTDVSYENN